MGRVKSLEEIKAMVRERTGRQGVFRRAQSHDVESVLVRLKNKDPDHWAAEWSRVARPYEDEGAQHELAGHGQEARAAYMMAHTYYTLGRYPVPHTPGKKEAFRKSLELFEKAGRHFNPPLEKLSIPYGEKVIPAYLRVPNRNEKQPVVINFGGIDSYKAESYDLDETLLQAGLGTCAMDMPGVGESPIHGSTTAETLFSAVINHLAMRLDIDPGRMGILGRSFGGYWAAKMAFTEASRLRAAVVWGGGIHYFFQEQWQRKSTNADSYLMDHEIARARAFGVKNLEEIIELFPSLSLKTQGWLDKTSSPMLVVNGKDDLQTPIEDLYILLESGSPKAARVFPGGHMGHTPETVPTIIQWLKRELA